MSGDASSRRRQKELARALAEIDFALPGSLAERYLTCTHAGCHCHDDPPTLHGPYWYWTRKVDNKTVSKLLSQEQVADYRAWFENRKRLRELIRQLEELSIAVVNDDPRTPKRRRARSR